MVTRNFSSVFKTVLLSGFFLLAINKVACAQSNPANKVLVVSPSVGEVIDAEERERFRLFPLADSAGFVFGRFLLTPEKQIVLEIMQKNGKMEYRNYSQTEFELTGELIAMRAAAAKPPVKAASPSAPPIRPNVIKNQTPKTTFLSSETVYYVILNTQMSFFATIAERQDGAYVFNTQQYGSISAPHSSIRYMKPVENRPSGEYWIPNAHDSRLFFGPTGRGIPKGEGYFQVYYIYLAAANVGITDNFSIGAMTTVIPFIGIENQFVFLTPKLSFKLNELTSISTGVLYTHFFDNSQFGNPDFGLLYSAGTFGSPDKNITAGIGYAFAEGEVIQKPVGMFGGNLRVSNRLAIMSENYILPLTGTDNFGQEIPETYVAGLYGLRFIWPKSNLDLAGGYVYTPQFDNGWNEPAPRFYSSWVLPVFISYSMRLGNRRNIGKY